MPNGALNVQIKSALKSSRYSRFCFIFYDQQNNHKYTVNNIHLYHPALHWMHFKCAISGKKNDLGHYIQDRFVSLAIFISRTPTTY